MSTAQPALRRWTRDEFYRMAKTGLFNGQRVELVEGEILVMSPFGPGHVAAVHLAAGALESAFGPGYWVRLQSPLHLGPRSEPEPDVCVVAGGPRDFPDHPTTASLVVEVSDSTLQFDQSRKRAIYAAAGIPEYWIINLVDGVLEVYRGPAPHRRPAGGPQAADYQDQRTLSAGDTISPLAMPGASIAVADLLP